MRIKEWIGENISYRFFGCFYNKFQDPLLFPLLESTIPEDSLGRSIADLGCADGTNTLRLKEVFKANLYHALFDAGKLLAILDRMIWAKQ